MTLYCVLWNKKVNVIVTSEFTSLKGKEPVSGFSLVERAQNNAKSAEVDENEIEGSEHPFILLAQHFFDYSSVLANFTPNDDCLSLLKDWKSRCNRSVNQN